MAFTLIFLQILWQDLLHAAPILCSLLLAIVVIGFAIGRIEGWKTSDALYHAFINATTVGYGDLRPSRRRSKALAILLAFLGLVFTGMIVAISLHAADQAYARVYEVTGFLDRSGA